jgi:hypothetical protein
MFISGIWGQLKNALPCLVAIIGTLNIRYGWPLWFGTLHEKRFQSFSAPKNAVPQKKFPSKEFAYTKSSVLLGEAKYDAKLPYILVTAL